MISMQRYNTTQTKTLGPGDVRKLGTEVYRSTTPLKVEPQDDDTLITVNAGDRLDALAARFYGSPALWFVLASVNNLTNGSMHITPGTQLRIPSVTRVTG